MSNPIHFSQIGVTQGHMHSGGPSSVHVWFDQNAQVMHAECGTCKEDLVCLSVRDNTIDLDDPAARTIRGVPSGKKIRHTTWG